MYQIRHVARELAANAAMGIPAIKARRVRQGRTIGFPPDVKAKVVMEQFDFFIAAIGRGNIEGKVIAEIGPGDAIPLAPLFLAAGAKRYLAVDRFLGEIHGPQALGVYRALLGIAPALLIEQLNRVLQLEGCDSIADLIKLPGRVELYRTPIEEPDKSLAGRADYVVSWNVCEHLADLPKAMRGMRSMLAPTGLMVHRIDYGPHDIWLSYHNPLAFLTVPGSLWRWTTSNRGCPNRVRHGELMAIVRALGMSTVDRIGRRASSADISEARPHIAAEFQSMSDDEIAILDAEVICARDANFDERAFVTRT